MPGCLVVWGAVSTDLTLLAIHSFVGTTPIKWNNVRSRRSLGPGPTRDEVVDEVFGVFQAQLIIMSDFNCFTQALLIRPTRTVPASSRLIATFLSFCFLFLFPVATIYRVLSPFLSLLISSG